MLTDLHSAPITQVTATQLRSLHPVLADTELCWELRLNKAEQHRQPLLSDSSTTLHALYLPAHMLKLDPQSRRSLVLLRGSAVMASTHLDNRMTHLHIR